MWGTVGGGKTMLMDMFYHTLEGKQSDYCTVQCTYSMGYSEGGDNAHGHVLSYS